MELVTYKLMSGANRNFYHHLSSKTSVLTDMVSASQKVTATRSLQGRAKMLGDYLEMTIEGALLNLRASEKD